jgi:hypothetical protein
LYCFYGRQEEESKEQAGFLTIYQVELNHLASPYGPTTLEDAVPLLAALMALFFFIFLLSMSANRYSQAKVALHNSKVI